MGLKFLVEEQYQLPQMNAVLCPSGVDEAAGAQDAAERVQPRDRRGPRARSKGKIWRFGLMGYSCRPDNVMLCLSALGSVLMDMGLPIKVGEAEAAAHQAYASLHAADALHARKKIATAA